MMGGFGIEPKRKRTNEGRVEGHDRIITIPALAAPLRPLRGIDARSGSFSLLCVVQATDEVTMSRGFSGRQRDFCGLTKTRRNQKWQRDPEGMRLRILEAAKEEFAAYGLAGARVDRIAAKAGANKRMLYYHVGKKDELYLTVLEGAYEKIRIEKRGLDLDHLDPPKAIDRLIEFTWNYFLRNPEFLALLNTENLAKARHLKRSTKVKSMHSPFVEMIRTVVIRGVESGDFLVSVDPVQLYISIAALSFFYLSNSATLSVIFGRDLLKKEARDERLDHMVALVLAALTGKSFAAFGGKKALPVSVPQMSSAK